MAADAGGVWCTRKRASVAPNCMHAQRTVMVGASALTLARVQAGWQPGAPARAATRCGPHRISCTHNGGRRLKRVHGARRVRRSGGTLHAGKVYLVAARSRTMRPLPPPAAHLNCHTIPCRTTCRLPARTRTHRGRKVGRASAHVRGYTRVLGTIRNTTPTCEPTASHGPQVNTCSNAPAPGTYLHTHTRTVQRVPRLGGV